MKHKQFEEWLLLSLYDELREQDRSILENHLTVCGQCRTDLGELKKLHITIAHRSPSVVQEKLLHDARLSLKLQVHSRVIRMSFWSALKDTLDDILASPIQVATSGIVILIIGIFVGYLIFKEPSEKSMVLQQSAIASSGVEAGETQISSIRFLDRNAQTGDVEFTFETVTPVRIRGNVNDEYVQKVLARALVSEQNAGIRLRAVNMIGTQTEKNQNGNPELDAEVKSALITALLHDRNLGVRREALGVLRNYLPDPVIVRAFLQVLANEKNTGLKITAINSLDLSKYENQPVNREILEMLRHKAQSDDNNYIRIKAKTALQEVQQ